MVFDEREHTVLYYIQSALCLKRATPVHDDERVQTTALFQNIVKGSIYGTAAHPPFP